MSNLQCLFHEITFLLQFTSQYWSNSFHRTENVRRIQTIRCSCGSLCYGWNKQHCIFCIIQCVEHFQTTTNISSDFSNFKSSPTNNRFHRTMHKKKIAHVWRNPTWHVVGNEWWRNRWNTIKDYQFDAEICIIIKEITSQHHVCVKTRVFVLLCVTKTLV